MNDRSTILEFREWLQKHRARGTLIMQEGADITNAEAVAPWQDRMQVWVHSLISMAGRHDQAEAGRFEPLVRITHPNILPNPVSDEHQMSWRCHFERLVRLDDFLDRLNKRFGIAGIEQLPRPAKPPRGYKEQDAPLLEEMHNMIVSGKANNVPYAADAVASKAVGKGKEKSKSKRLEQKYMEEYKTR